MKGCNIYKVLCYYDVECQGKTHKRKHNCLTKFETSPLWGRGSFPASEEIQLLNSLTPHLYFCWYEIHLKPSTVGFADVTVNE